MKLRVRSRAGVSNITVDPTATLADLYQIISATSISTGFPPKPLTDPPTTPLSSVLRNGDVIVAQQTQSTATPSATPATRPAPPSQTSHASSIPRPPKASSSIASEGEVLMREVPDDNSCLFRSVSALLGHASRGPQHLRQIIANHVVQNPEQFPEIVLGRPTDEYAAWIMSDTAWGGAIELSILAEHFKIQLAAFDVHTMRLDRYAESSNYSTVAFLIYTGIHYNYVALSLSGMAKDADITQFDPNDEYVLHKVREVAQVLHDSRSYTDTTSFSLKCLQCNAKFRGESEALKHAKSMGHTQFDEV